MSGMAGGDTGAQRARPWWIPLIVVAEVGLFIGTTLAFGFFVGIAVFVGVLLPVVLIMLPVGIVQGYRRANRRD